ncbi:MAG: winged helix-turn-helix domain-containing protein, partial [Lachnospiraceae bacterium]
ADAQAELLQCHDLFIDISKRIVSVKEKHISLTPKEFDILCFFAANQGRVFSKEQIYNHIWGTDYVVDDSNITAHIRRVRKKIEPNPSNPIYIKTVWGVGYRFCES